MEKNNPQRPRIGIRLSYRKKIVFGLLATCLFYTVAEILLALCSVQPRVEYDDPFVGFESTIPLFREEVLDDGEYLRTADNKLTFFNMQRFRKRKDPNVFRVFCLGGSTTYGRPYDDSTSFVGWLRELLHVADDNHEWEVINAGGISYASYRVAHVLDELCSYEPDLFIIYTGHNEFLEERSYRNLHDSSKAFRRATALLYHSRTFSLMAELLSRDNFQADTRWKLPSEVDTILDHAVGPAAYHRDPKLRTDILNHFEFNLARSIQTAQAVGARVVLVSPACNLKDFSPFKSEYQGEVEDSRRRRWIEFFSNATVLAERGQVRAALAELQHAEELDSGRADLHYRRGQLLQSEKQYDAAHASFLTAIDQDVCPLRAVPAIRELVEQAAVQYRAPLVDFAGILENDCLHRHGHPSPGKEYFLDHVHPTIEANRLLALALCQAMIQIGILTPNELWREQAVALASRRIESHVNPELQARALTNLAQVLSWAGKQSEAGPLAVEALRLRNEHGLAENPENMFYAAVHYTLLGANDKARELLENVVRLQSDNVQAHRRLAELYYDFMDYENARRHCESVLRLDPRDIGARNMLQLATSRLAS